MLVFQADVVLILHHPLQLCVIVYQLIDPLSLLHNNERFHFGPHQTNQSTGVPMYKYGVVVVDSSSVCVCLGLSFYYYT